MIYYDSTAIDAVNEGRDIPDAFYNPVRPSELIATRRWHASSAWRGYNEVLPEPGYKDVLADWTTGDWGDAISELQGSEATEAKVKAAEKQFGTVYVIFTPTSNVFSTGVDILAADPGAEPVNKGRVVGHKTRRFDYPDGSWKVRYHATDVVAYDAATGKYKLDSGGWNTMTTAKRMSEYLPSGYHVYRHKWELYLRRPNSPHKWGADEKVIDGKEVKLDG